MLGYPTEVLVNLFVFKVLLMVINNKLQWKQLPGFKVAENHWTAPLRARPPGYCLPYLHCWVTSGYIGDDTYLSFVFKINSSYLEEAYHRNILISKSGSWLGWCKGSYIWNKCFWKSFFIFQIIFKEFILRYLAVTMWYW